jgi:Phytanoyl-CoA dioxygenase (PhyH)
MGDMLVLDKDGAELASGALLPDDLNEIKHLFDDLATANAGLRISPERLGSLNSITVVGDLVTQRLGLSARAVRAILFDKREANNWALGWHQDRTIAVKARKDVEGFGPWTVKGGTHHVAPPIELLERMITVRIHVDIVDEDNAPLLIAPESHRRGLIAERDIDAVVATCGQQACLAEAGDVWLYSTPILHASARAIRPRRRRVLQIDYSADDLSGGLEWAADA